MFKRFIIQHLGTPEFWEELDRAALPYEGNRGPLERTVDALRAAPWNAQSAVFEYGYIDRDYLDEFSAFYSKSFKAYTGRCTRVHFFSIQISKRVVRNFGRFQKHYLGYVVLRPTDLYRMGKTVLRPPIANPDTEFIHCLAKFEANILGDCLAIEAMPFIQQDTQVGACAQAALWGVARYMARRFGHREYLPSEINHLAKAKSARGRQLPAEFGLSPFQMLDALEGMGFFSWAQPLPRDGRTAGHVAPAFPVPTYPKPTEDQKKEIKEAFDLQCSAKLADIAYRYIESGLPVILATHDHALVAIGHTYDPATTATVAIQRIPSWFVHNDNTGCYIQMPLLSRPPQVLSFRDVQAIMPIVPREVTLRGEEAEAMSRECIDELLMTPIAASTSATIGDVIRRLRPDLASYLNQLEYRTYLVPATEFQSSLKADMRSGRVDRKLWETLIRIDYPRFIWVTEISSSRLLNHPDRRDRACLGRVIIDSTAPSGTRGQMVIHFCDFVHLIDRQNSKENRGIFPNSTPFGHRIAP